MALFDTVSRTKRERDKEIADKLQKKVERQQKSSGNNLLSRINDATRRVMKNLGVYADDYLLLTEEKEIIEYFDKLIESGLGAVDTETTGLDYFNDELVGVGLYCKGLKASYIPVNHKSAVYGNRLENQASEKLVREQILRLVECGFKLIYHNGKFDCNVFETFTGVPMPEVYWDTMVASQIIRRDEKDHSLKGQYDKKCSHLEPADRRGAMSKFGSLFEGITFDYVPLEVAKIYGARDPYITYVLYEYQLNLLSEDEYADMLALLRDIEFPLVNVIAGMEREGVEIDMDYCNELDIKYSRQLKEAEDEVYDLIREHETEIMNYRAVHFNAKLDDPININSPAQLAILLYDILGYGKPTSDGKKPVGEALLSEMKQPLTDKILEYRSFAKIVGTYVKAIPKRRNKKTGKVHTEYMQNGAETGRQSSRNPNLQNIPSKNKEIRKMFIPGKGRVFISVDYSQQEPRTLSHLCGDERFIEAYATGKDIYAFIGSMVYNVPYDDCREFKPDGTKNPEGTKRRNSMKSVVLGIMYGRGSQSIAEQLGVSVQEAEHIIQLFFESFPDVKKYVDQEQHKAKELGYTTTIWGRRRYLKYIQKDEYEFEYGDNRPMNFDPLFDSLDALSNKVEPELAQQLVSKILSLSYGRRQAFIRELQSEQGIIVYNYSEDVAEAKRQVVNSEIQGSSADLTKLAMVTIWRNKRLKELDYKLVMTVHDETIGTCPKHNALEAGKLVRQIMIDVAATKISVPMACDVDYVDRWYGNDVPEEELC